MVAAQELVQEEMERLLEILPPRVKSNLEAQDNLPDLLEVVLDLGRFPEARFPGGDVILDEREVTREDLDYLVKQIGDFGDDNRAGMERTLHRISAIRNRKGQVVGITCRAGRAVFGTIKIIEDLAVANKNILLLGRPGVGKTTMLREVARVLADEARKRVVIVDTSNEIAGDGDVPHPAIGHARRMQVATPTRQHAVMIEAVENHMPQVIIIDEMGSEEEAAAARTIAERGVQLVATAHGNTLDNLILNPTLSDLVGGIQSVTLGDQEARYRGTQKTVLERKAPPTFDVVVEIQSWEQVAVHDGVAQVVDQWLRGYPIVPVIRSLDEAGEVIERQGDPRPNADPPAPWTQDYGGGRRSDRRQGKNQDRYYDRGQDRGQERGQDRGRDRQMGQPAGPQPLYQRNFMDDFGGGPDRSFAPGAPQGVSPGVPPGSLRESYGESTGPDGAEAAMAGDGNGNRTLEAQVFLFGVSRDKLETAQAEMGLNVNVVNELRRASLVLTTKTHYRRGAQLVRSAESTGTPVYVLRKNTMPQVMDFLRTLAREQGIAVRGGSLSREDAASDSASRDTLDRAMLEAEDAAQRVLGGEFSVQLNPQRAYVRRLQHLLAQRFNLASTSRGREPERSVLIYRA